MVLAEFLFNFYRFRLGFVVARGLNPDLNLIALLHDGRHPLDKSTNSKPVLSVQTIVLLEVTWAVLALLFFLLFSATPPGQERPFWYSLGTWIFEQVSYFSAFLLCLRNWLSRQIVSGRNVWTCIGLGMLSYFIGNLFFFLWEDIFQIRPDVSPGDIFYVLTYALLIIGMLLAVTARRLNLEIWQWGIVALIAALGIVLAWFISSRTVSQVQRPALMEGYSGVPPTVLLAQAPPSQQNLAPNVLAQQPVPASPAPKTQPESSNAPQWAQQAVDFLEPAKPFFDWFYIISDILLLILAATLLLAFWGGRFAQSWRMIAAAAACLYVSDIWFKYATNTSSEYQSGSLPEVFWIFSGVLFGIGAALEYDVSSRSRRSTGRRRAT